MGILTRQARNIVAAALTAVLCAFGYEDARNLLADFARSRAESLGSSPAAAAWVERALRLRPDLSQNWMAGAERLSFDEPHRARSMAARGVQLDPENWSNWRQLGLIDLRLGDTAAAEADLTRAARVDRGFEAHFTLASLAWLLNDRRQFEQQMRSALRLATGDQIAAALSRARELTGGDPGAFAALLPPSRPLARLSAIRLLAQTGAATTAQSLWQALPPCSAELRATCKSTARQLIQEQLAAAAKIDPTASPQPTAVDAQQGRLVRDAMQVWNGAVKEGYFDAPRVRWGHITDPSFEYPWVGGWSWVGFRWPVRIQATPDGLNAISFKFDGSQPVQVALLSQWVPVQAGSSYRVGWSTRAAAVQDGGGVALDVNTADGARLATLPAKLASAWTASSAKFQVPPNEWLADIIIVYRRPYAVAMMQGQVWARQLRLDPAGTAGSDKRAGDGRR